MGLEWNGPQISARVREASAHAVEAVAERAAARASDRWPIDTGESAGSIAVLQRPHDDGRGVATSWGSPLLKVLLNEIGVRGRPGLNLLRQSGDEEYGRLAGEIRERLR